MKHIIDIDTEALIKEAARSAEAVARKSISANLAHRFRGPLGFWDSPGGGDLYDLMLDKVKDLVSSDEFDQMINRIIREKMEAAADSAVKTALNHLARKKVFLERV